MTNLTSITLVLIFVSIGCASIQKGASFERINEVSQTRPNSILLNLGLTIAGDGLRVTPDSTYWIDLVTMTPQAALTSAVAAITFPKRTVGITRGAAVGATLVGVSIRITLTEEACTEVSPVGGHFGCRRVPDNLRERQFLAFLIGGVVGGVIGTIPGTLAGGIVGGKIEYPVTTPDQSINWGGGVRSWFHSYTGGTSPGAPDHKLASFAQLEPFYDHLE